MIKLIASDLDGTLLTDSKELSQTTVQILDMAVKKGIYVIPATDPSGQYLNRSGIIRVSGM